MKTLLTTILALTCAVILIWGNMYWKEKSIVSGSAEDPAIESSKIETSPLKEDEGAKAGPKDFAAYTKNWPEEGAVAFEKARKEKRPFELLILGSESLGDESTGWAYQVKNGLESFYGQDILAVKILTSTKDTLAFVRDNGPDLVAKENPDLILFEPFTLNDNGVVRIEDSLENIETIIDTVKEANPDAAFILQPPNPIYQPKLYATQVEALKDYAAENSIVYLNHWEAWPDVESEEIQSYLQDGTPNEEGHKVWGQYVADFLIGK